MSMSDSGLHQDWQRWQPESLLEDPEPPLAVPAPSLPVDLVTDAQVQAELARLRQQAEHEGYAAGERRGREEGQKKGYEEGVSQGREKGLEQGETEARARQQALVGRFTQLVDEFEASLDSLDSVIPARLVQLSINAVRAMLGKHIVCDPERLLETIQQLMQNNLRLVNNPELWVSEADFPLVKAQLGDALEARRWALRVEGKMAPGDCRITAEEGELDATLAVNWQRLCDLSQEAYRP
ncbi:flagellar assembly protein FliH [Enterobacter sp. BIGb0383]|uniref:flagellar assembly protein FliH n=1 Tax=unclassified Enterobacter TaxID=2608935 RepID=UPI000F483147|nr:MULTISPECIES: flagellar assembly protein FliH [unclassified Enterobacter]ROP58330.1 flagellar assembly protein FliH [Enterobacter sp. BIGb0383]ROS06782.1 flagellar assembly protein FliH [Enterobacter sp. BIGb0359]